MLLVPMVLKLASPVKRCRSLRGLLAEFSLALQLACVAHGRSALKIVPGHGTRRTNLVVAHWTLWGICADDRFCQRICCAHFVATHERHSILILVP